jgi:hypothetical protein
MNKLAVLCLLLACASGQAFATIGDTEQQFAARYIQVKRSQINPAILIGFGKYTTVAAEFINNSSEQEVICTKDGRPLSWDEVNYWLKKYGVSMITDAWPNKNYTWVRKDGRVWMEYELVPWSDRSQRHGLVITTDSWFASNSLNTQQQPNVATVTPPPATLPPAAAPTATPMVTAPLVQSDGGQDCMVVAVEYYNRLQGMPFRNILSVGYKDKKIGHAYAVWKLKPGGIVWVGDGSGSFQLDTGSTKLEDVLASLQKLMRRLGDQSQIIAGKWEYADGVAVQGPVVFNGAVAQSQAHDVGYAIAYCLGIVLMLVGGLSAIAFYFLPTIISGMKKKPNTGAIFLLNLFLGWTFLGWLGALIWSATNDAGRRVTA